MLLASTVSGLFKWRQFEPEVILPGGGLVSAFFLVVPGRRGVARRARSARRSRYGVALGPAVCPRNGTTFALLAQTDQGQLASGRNLHPGQGQVGLFIPGCRLRRCDDRLPSVG